MFDEVVEDFKLIKAERDIRNMLYLYCRAVDRGDDILLRSIYHADATEDHFGYVGGVSGFVDLASNMRSWMESGSHQITNILIEIDGDIAKSESNFFGIAANCTDPEGEQIDLFITGRYLDRFERREGSWKIAARQVVFDTNHTFKASGRWEGALYGNFTPRGRSDREDLLYNSVAAPPDPDV